LTAGPTGARHRIVQIHATRTCNLRCVHCYSLSGPEERGELDATLLRAALSDAAAEGYTVAGFSGGEPTLYRPLPELLQHAHACGLRTTMTSNGMLLTHRLLASLEGNLDVLAISLDGVPASHNRIRASHVAFAKMFAKLENVRESGIPFGFIFTLTQHNLGELDWVARFALEQGARLLQIHPLEQVGRAKEQLQGQTPDTVENSFAHLEAQRIQELAGDRMLVQLDVVDSSALPDHREHVYADDPTPDEERAPLGELLSPLVIEADGTVVPLEYGFARAFALGNLHDAGLRELAQRWRGERHAEFRAVCRNVYDRLTGDSELPFSNWYELVAQEADRALVR
jgi:MoaA/NifB/PqqE/SkfB family radical SAM enzyme